MIMNWRINLLALMAVIALVFAISEAETLTLFILSKVIALALGLATYLIGKHWNNKGIINLDELEE